MKDINGSNLNIIDVRNFIQDNITTYEGDESFLASISPKTKKVFEGIVSYNIHPFHMYEGIIIYGNTHDIRL
ncbi:MAG: hypothetical protein J6C97_05320 [Clostridia bacterium]|nr:hypothetical protein [Clostridia bacterium]